MPRAGAVILSCAFAWACQVSTSSSSSDPESEAKPAADAVAAPDPDPQVAPVQATPVEPDPTPAPDAKTPDAKTGEIQAKPDPGDASPERRKCADGEHAVGDRWKVECNDCWCKDDGKVVCTRKHCPKKG